MNKTFYVYILRSVSGALYIGVTNNIITRLYQHKSKFVEGYTSKYNVDKLVYYELFSDSESAITREKQLKNWSREKKIKLISLKNPELKEITIESLV